MTNWAAAEQKAKGQRGLITFEQLEALEFGGAAVKWAVKSGRLVRMFRRAYRFAVVSPTRWQRALAGTMLAGDTSALSHATAAAIWGLNGFPELGGTLLHLSVPDRCKVQLPKDFVVHRPMQPFEPYVLKGLRVTRLARTLVDIAPLVSEERLETILDAAQHRFSSLPRWLTEELVLHKAQRPGLRRLITLLSLRQGIATESPLETTVRRRIREAGLPQPQLQFEIFDLNGVYVMRVDFAWPLHRVALHVDGFVWHAQRQAFDRDADQRSRLASLGWLSLSVTSTSLRDKLWIDQLRRVLEQREPQQSLFVSQ